MEEQKIRIKSIIEIVGTPEEHVQKAMDMVVEKLGEKKDLEIVKKEIFPTNKLENSPFWSCFCDVELVADNLDVTLQYCFEFLPSSVEILNPTSFTTQNLTLTQILNDVLARLHEYNMVGKNEHARVVLLQRELEKLKGAKKTDRKEEPKKK